MTKNRNVRCYFWLDNCVVQNLGDYIGAVVLEAMGYRAISLKSQIKDSVNPGRCLLPIGSVLSERILQNITEPVDVWGCGWRGATLQSSIISRMRFHAVRGPETVAGLGLPPDTPIGDPALLLPQLLSGRPKQHGRTLVIPHFYCTERMSAIQRCRSTGCDKFLSTKIIGKPVPGVRSSPIGIGAMLKTYLKLGVPIHTGRQAIYAIAGAGFVLTGSLHGAIISQAYGVPWAAYDDGYVNVPEKWYDWAAYLGVPIEFVTTLAEGKRWWETKGCTGAIRDLSALLSAFPYPISSEIRQRFQ